MDELLIERGQQCFVRWLDDTEEIVIKVYPILGEGSGWMTSRLFECIALENWTITNPVEFDIEVWGKDGEEWVCSKILRVRDVHFKNYEHSDTGTRACSGTTTMNYKEVCVLPADLHGLPKSCSEFR